MKEPVLEGVRRTLDKASRRRPSTLDVTSLVRSRKANTYSFAADGETPNNSFFPMIHYRTPVKLDDEYDPASVFEVLFASHGWGGAWRNGIHDYLHFHTRKHEVLGIARGTARVEFGGRNGRTLDLKAGDVVVLPAGTGHRKVSGARNLLVVGAYPEDGAYDEVEPEDIPYSEALARVRKAAPPAFDPVYGAGGPLKLLWKAPH